MCATKAGTCVVRVVTCVARVVTCVAKVVTCAAKVVTCVVKVVTYEMKAVTHAKKEGTRATEPVSEDEIHSGRRQQAVGMAVVVAVQEGWVVAGWNVSPDKRGSVL
jgi:hypothetical protein